MKVTTEHRVFVVKTYYKTTSYLEVKEDFHRRFPEKSPTENRTTWKNIEKTNEKEQV